MEEWIFITPNAPSFKWKARAGMVQFVNGQFKTSNAELAAELRTAIDPASPCFKQAVAMYIRYADKEAAARIVKRHQLAVAGTMTSAALTSARLAAETEQRDAELQTVMNNPAAAQAFQNDIARDVLTVTQSTAGANNSLAAMLKVPAGDK